MSVLSRVEYRALEGFVLAVSPFNFTAIGGNLPGVPALVGNVILWKPSPAATYSNYIVYQLLEEAGIPPGVIQFVPGPPAEVVAQAISHPLFAGLHFTGSTAIFKQLWKDIAQNLDIYKGYPRIVGETGVLWLAGVYELPTILTTFPLGGKNFHVVHSSADVENAVFQTLRSAFEYQGALLNTSILTSSHGLSGQKCSALSRLYVSSSVWNAGGFKDKLLEQVAGIKVGSPLKFDNFMGPVM